MTDLWDDPAQTAERLRGGWVLTGDIGRLDDNGYLYVIDRKDDMIVSGGFNIWPAELERVIGALPGVREVVVFGVPHERWGETPVAEVIAEPGADRLGRGQSSRPAVTSLGSYKQPRPGRVPDRAVPAQPGRQASAQSHPRAVLGRAGSTSGRS